MPTTIGPAEVKLTGGTYVSNCKLRLAKLTTLGVSPNATVKIYAWNPPDKNVGFPGGFTEYDKLTEATIESVGDDNSKMRITGKSEMAREDVVNGSDEDITVKWDVKISGSCNDCG